MAGRTRAALAAAHAKGPGLLDLPKDCTFRILRLLAFPERCPEASALSLQLSALVPGLVRQGPHLRRLDFRMGIELDDDLERAAMAACLTAAGIPGQLTEVSCCGWILNTEWLAAMPSLRQLKLVPADNWVRFSPAVSRLAALASLEARGTHIAFYENDPLPPSLTCLALGQLAATSMSQQVAGPLPHLAQLEFDRCRFSADSMAPLSRLAGSLTLLHVAHGEVPASLAALTNVRHLRLLDCRPEEASNEAHAAALPHLTQLTRLEQRGLAPPPSLTNLPAFLQLLPALPQ